MGNDIERKDDPRRFTEWNAQEPVDNAVRSANESPVIKLDGGISTLRGWHRDCSAHNEGHQAE